jgi:predicted  nucleic acid-binding Zn-ribbon protein
MEQLDLLWNLEIHFNSLESYKYKLEQAMNTSDIKNIADRVKKTENKLVSLRDNLEKYQKKLKENNLILKDYNYQLEEIEKNLYDGTIIDLRQLDYLSKERDKLKALVNSTEIDMLFIMEEIEDIEVDLNNMETSLEEIKKDYKKLRKYYKSLSEELNNKIKEEGSIIEDLLNKIDKDLLNRYHQLRENRGNGFGEIKNNVCSGCNILIPTYIVDKLKNNKDIIYCENCGRILYYNKEPN